MLKNDIKEPSLAEEFEDKGNHKNKLLKRIQREGNSLVYAKNQCSCIMNNGSNDYGIIVLVKRKPGFSLKYDRMEHGVDYRHIEWLLDKVPYIQVWIYEKQSKKLLMGYYHKLSKHQHTVKGFAVDYVPRAELYDATSYLQGKTPHSELPTP
jgi:hypothetical protein